MKVLLFDNPLAQFLFMWFGGRRHCARRGQLEGEDQGGPTDGAVLGELNLYCVGAPQGKNGF